MGKTRKIKLGDIVLSVNPVELEVIIPQLSKCLTLLSTGTVNPKGDRGVAIATISSFFPSWKSPFCRCINMSPKKYEVKVENWEKNKETKRLIITDMGVSLAMLTDKRSSKVKEGDKGMYYTLELSEYRNLTVPAVSIPLQVRDNSSKQHPNEAVPAKTHTMGSGDTLWGIAKKIYGDGTQSSRIYAASSAVIEAVAKQRGKSSSNNGQWIYSGTVPAIP